MSSKAHILVVDDEASSRSGLERLLKQAGYTVDTAACGAKALEIAAQRPADLVVTDLRMPFMDGMRLVEKLRAFGDIASAVAAMRAGAADFLTKPIDIEVLLSAIERALLRRALQPPLSRPRPIQT